MEDKEIIGLFLARDENAVRQTELKYSGYLLTIALNILGSREDSGECVNDTYFKAWNSIPPHLPERLRYYLGKITRELSIDRLRRKVSAKRGGTEYELSLDELEECVPSASSAQQTGAPEQEAEVSLLAETIGKYLRGCGAEMRNVFIMRYYFCDSVKAIADCCGMSESKVKSMLFRARGGLRKHLEKEGFSV
ncbi:MAG: sigma-70 family RNA polymerase sigma factor [Prevotella sp.]|nr:sigma-70 family RNA polymerase sigma factor [Prevotella sp.]